MFDFNYCLSLFYSQPYSLVKKNPLDDFDQVERATIAFTLDWI